MLPSNRFKALGGDRKCQYSIRINDQWRICFNWSDAGPENVEIVDFHSKGVTIMARNPIHPGEILADELTEVGNSAAELARQINVPANRISQILSGKRSITADTALRLGRWFGTGPKISLNLQQAYEFDMAKIEIGPDLETIKPLEAA